MRVKSQKLPFVVIVSFMLFFSGLSAILLNAQPDTLPACAAAVDEMRLLQTAIPVTSPPPATADPNAPAPTASPIPPTPRPAPAEDRVGFPEGYPENFRLLFVFDRPDNRQVRVICGNDLAASVQPGEPFPYGSVMVMETWRARLGENGQPVLDDAGHYIREALTGIFVMRKEEGFGEAYLEDRSGEWEYVAYRPNGEHLIPPERTNNCASCHLRQAGESVDFAFRMAMFHDPEMAFVAPEVGANEINMFIYEFMPMELTVPAGTTVTWINNDEAEHTVTASDGLFDSGNIMTANVAPGASFSFTFTEPGTYEYTCTIHPRMSGTIVVTG
jgi:plastocyanin